MHSVAIMDWTNTCECVNFSMNQVIDFLDVSI